ncbi:hypothetical protein PG997_001122 [Apiospora hydei]|uniref:Uncharacterized protein n=1 Tax=Apiospora hydei TaxID=1337664 RepID=A0ABR1XCM5_9PEZI
MGRPEEAEPAGHEEAPPPPLHRGQEQRGLAASLVCDFCRRAATAAWHGHDALPPVPGGLQPVPPKVPVRAVPHHRQGLLITIPALPNFGRPTTEEPLEPHMTMSGAGYAFSLEVQRGTLGAITPVGGDDNNGGEGKGDDPASNQWTRERFEWRHSRGNEVKQLDKLNSGWKLVRIHSEADGVGGTRRARDAGASSDGKELVAVFAEVSGWSASKVVKFKFLGSGATGEMGPRWALMAVMTALRIWDTQNGLSESAAATAAGVAGASAGGGHSRSASKAKTAAGGDESPTYGAPGVRR